MALCGIYSSSLEIHGIVQRHAILSSRKGNKKAPLFGGALMIGLNRLLLYEPKSFGNFFAHDFNLVNTSRK
jgi:hypothetical protein